VRHLADRVAVALMLVNVSATTAATQLALEEAANDDLHISTFFDTLTIIEALESEEC
jgi:hypothetical protein